MVSAEILDFSQLVAPISGDQPVGCDLRDDTSPSSVYYQVKDHRSQARAIERQALMDGEANADAADWRPILSLAPEVLAERSKDLEITAYLIEALVRRHGFAGVRDGFRLARELVEHFADDIYPLPDEDGLETRVAPLTGLNGEGADGTLIAPINAIPITDQSSVGAFSTAQYQQALELERLPVEVRERRLSQGAVDLQTIQLAVAESSAEFYRNLLDDITAAAEEFSNLGRVMDEKYGEFSPPVSNIRGALRTCRETVEALARDKLASLEPEVAEDEQADSAGENVATTAGVAQKASVDAITTREEAFRILLKVAEFFRRTEPHTPVSYALERLVRWGQLPLPELLRELIADETSDEQMFKLVGISSPSEDGEQE